MRLLKVEPDRAKGWLILLSLLRPLLPPLPVKTAAPQLSELSTMVHPTVL